jgi:hypothetical protein
MAYHERNTGVSGRCDDGTPFRYGRSNRLFHQDMRPALDAANCQLEVQVGRRGDRDGIHALRKQILDMRKGCTAQRPGHHLPLLAVRVRHADQCYARHVGKHARVIASHNPHADNADAQSGVRAEIRGFDPYRQKTPSD